MPPRRLIPPQWEHSVERTCEFQDSISIRFFMSGFKKIKKSYISNKDGTDLTAAANSTPVSAVKTLSVRPPLKKKKTLRFFHLLLRIQ